jgi:hypothetical protein
MTAAVGEWLLRIGVVATCASEGDSSDAAATGVCCRGLALHPVAVAASGRLSVCSLCHDCVTLLLLLLLLLLVALGLMLLLP